MASRTTISFLRSLQQKKFRIQEGCFLVEGPKLVQEVLQSSFEVTHIYALNSWELPAFSIKQTPEIITEKELEQVSTLQNPNKVLAVVKIPEKKHSSIAPISGLHLVIDQVQDPGNLGTIIRIADWFGFSSLICSPDTVEVYNPKVVQATMGSIFRVPVTYHPLPDLLIHNSTESKLPVFATILEGESLYEKPLSADGLIIMGNESRGINPLLHPFITRGLRIPEVQKHYIKAESLNVAVAAGIVCAEFRRQFPLP